MRILLTNDDGITAPGLAALYRAIRDLGDVHVVAPMDVQSAVGHAVTFHKPIVTRRQTVVADGSDLFEGIAVAGRPADCVKLAVNHLIEQPVDLVISGMNSGVNVGVNVLYSGTVAAAREGAIQGIRSIAVSLFIGDRSAIRWDAACRHARTVIEDLLDGPHQPDQFLNLNIPILDKNFEPHGVRVVPLSPSPLTDRYDSTHEPGGDPTYRVESSIAFRHTPPDTDVDAVFNGYITVTPLSLDSTHHPAVENWSDHLKNPD